MKLGSKESFFRPGSLKFFAFDGDLYCTLISHFAMIHRWAILFDDLPQTKWRFSIGSTISGNWFHGTYWMSNRMIQQWVSLDFQVFDGSNPSRPYCIILLVITHDILIICRYLMVNIPLFFHAFATGGHDISVVAFVVGPWEAGAHHHHSARSSGEAEARHGHHFGLIMDYEHISLVHLVYKYIWIMERELLCAYYVCIMCIYIYIHFLILCI